MSFVTTGEGERVSLDELSTSAFAASNREGGPPDDRLPPQDVGAEQSVLGGMLLSKDAIADCVEQLKGTDFYRPAHELIYDAILDLYGRGEPADAITVSDELTKRGDLSRIGGQAYLHQLIASVPTAANAGYYAQIVAERAVLRRLVEAGTRIVQLGYAQGGGDVEDIVNAAQAEVYSVADKRGGEDYHRLGEVIEATVDEIEFASGRSGEMTGVPTSFTDLDALTNGLHAGQMIVIAARPAMGKSTIGLDIVRSAAIKHKMAAVVFSLEMSRTEITMRLLSAEAGIQLQHMRKGTMREEDWTRLASTMGRVSEAPLFIDDSPNMSLMEIRAKCRRLKQRENLKLVVIDYLQLMSSGKRVESRQQEVSEFSRALKLLAKELEVPVIAISQLNRGAEQRTDKKPAMSDLRESGCLTADTRVTLADTGAQMSIAELVEEYRRNPGVELPVWSLDESLRYVRRPMTAVFPTGVRPVFRLTLASGKTVRATENHPFLTTSGWTQLGDLRSGSRIAVPRHVPAPESFVEELDDADLRLGALIMSTHTPDGPSGRLAARGCSIGFDLVEMSRRRLMPDIASFPKRQIGLLIDSLFALDGEVTVDKEAREGRIVLRHPSRRLLDDVAHLLLRFGISTSVAAEGDRWELDVKGVDDQRRFLQEVAVHTEKSAAAKALLQIVRERSESVVPEAEPVLSRSARRVSIRPEDFPEGVVGVDGLSLERLDELFNSLDLDLEASNDVLWDTIVDVEPDGVEEVFDATVLGTHNFIANGIAVHNSIEQDADIVILLHREAAYEKDSPREGEADLIVAKHRNGPTDTIVVAFQGHFSRFTNMATNF
ncbi:replicative DNA helicase [Humibacillus xanthopallidus]|uniref:Replicative DNA helicase n=1 Tax=Humibacillus xanthopallidus TaxID=412689 RepID=A0A543PNC6_9MICO|nr:replicative DNA helicase [Humibacillus xanthopallidus]TQN45581.1 replicative DNA helicase [Humibacillus xanthopallidus]